jgi:hypothetical protein
MAKLTLMEYQLLRTAAKRGVWVSLINAAEIDAAEKLASKGELKPVPKESSTSGTTFAITPKGEKVLKERAR